MFSSPRYFCQAIDSLLLVCVSNCDHPARGTAIELLVICHFDIFARSGNSWSQQAKIAGSREVGCSFGYSAAL